RQQAGGGLEPELRRAAPLVVGDRGRLARGPGHDQSVSAMRGVELHQLRHGLGVQLPLGERRGQRNVAAAERTSHRSPPCPMADNIPWIARSTPTIRARATIAWPMFNSST